jgi:hypothetical protein
MRISYAWLIALIVGILVLLGTFLPIEPLVSLRSLLLQWGMILAAFALLVGVINLWKVHWFKVKNRQPGSGYSILLLTSLVITLVIVGFFGPTAAPSMWIFNNIQVPLEASLAALLAIVLIYAGIRLLSRRPNTFSIIFIVTAFLVLLGSAPLFYFNEIPQLSWLRSAIIQVPAVAGSRGILIGVGLGIVVTGIRILMGVDHPYGE